MLAQIGSECEHARTATLQQHDEAQLLERLRAGQPQNRGSNAMHEAREVPVLAAHRLGFQSALARGALEPLTDQRLVGPDPVPGWSALFARALWQPAATA